MGDERVFPLIDAIANRKPHSETHPDCRVQRYYGTDDVYAFDEEGGKKLACLVSAFYECGVLEFVWADTA